MTLDVRGGLKNTAANQSNYVVFEEMLSNAIDSYLIRRSIENDSPPFSVEFNIEIFKTGLLEGEYDLAISCEDNGAGFGDGQVKAFVTKDSTYKDDLQIQGIGKCKGAGRIQFFHHFQTFTVDSVFNDGNGKARRKLTIDGGTREVSEESFKKSFVADENLRTVIGLKNRRIRNLSNESSDVLDDFGCNAVCMHIYKSFLQRLIVLKSLVGDFSILVRETTDGKSDQIEIKAEDLPEPIEKIEVPLLCTHGENQKTGPALEVTRYSFASEKNPGFQHEIALCANSSIVYSLTKKYIKTPSDRKRAIDGKFELILVSGALLEEKVNQQRDGFDIPLECTPNESLDEEFSLEDITDSLEDYVYGIITPKDFDRNQLVRSTQDKFGVTNAMLEEANVKIHFGDTEENIAKRVLKKYQDVIIKDTSSLVEMKEQLLGLDPREEGFRDKVNELSWQYTSALKKMDMANLSQLVVRRKAMIEILRHATNKLLLCQQAEAGKRNENEKIIHNVFFPMGKDNTDTKDHDIWLLNEEYQYFEHIASDKRLSSLKWIDGAELFEQDVDESLQKLFSQNNEAHSAKRPDIAVFSQEGAVIIIEFKAPGVPIQDHINDLVQYARLLAAKSNGKLKRFYGYLIGTTLDHSRMPTGWKRFPSNQGYFQTGIIEDPETGRQYGEIYSELLFYDQFINRAEKRLEVYRDKLGITL
jgi:hypothetical protein